MRRYLLELIEENIISEETAHRIQEYYNSKSKKNEGKLATIVGTIASLLIGLGVILIVAHNWDSYSKISKTLFAFIPLILSQLLGAYSLWKEKDGWWKEGSAILISCSIAATISLISQIYNIGGSLRDFLFTWMLLSLPTIYIFKSHLGSLLFLFGVLQFSWLHVSENGQWWIGYLFFLSILPFYFNLIREKYRGNSLSVHHWFVAIVLANIIPIFAIEIKNSFALVYGAVMIALYIAISNLKYFEKRSIIFNSYKFIGYAIGLFFLYFTTFSFVYDEAYKEFENLKTGYVVITFLLGLLSLVITFKTIKRLENLEKIILRPMLFLGYFLIVLYYLGMYSSISAEILANILVLGISGTYIYRGIKQDNFLYLNIGLFLFAILIALRFFDLNISFILKGILFLFMGGVFFGLNYFLIKRKEITK